MTGENIRLAFVGDLCMGGEFMTYARQRGLESTYPFHEVEPLFAQVDLGFANLEGPLRGGPEKKPRVTVHLFNDPVALDVLERLRVRVVSLGNNHMLDFGPKPLLDTIQTIESRGLQPIGAWKSDSTGMGAKVVQCKGKTFAFLGFTAFPDPDDQPIIRTLIADPGADQQEKVYAVEDVVQAVRSLRSTVDAVGVSLHWGYEYYEYPSDGQRRLAHQLAEAGCRFVIGHHPHTIQGIELYQGCLIFYSLGNFFLPPFRSTTGRVQYQKALAREFMIVFVEMEPAGGMTYRAVSGRRAKDYSLRPLVGKDQRDFTQRMERLSKPFKDGDYRGFWQAYQERRERELHKEQLADAVRKLARSSPGQLLKTIRPEDVTRNLKRLGKLLFKAR